MALGGIGEILNFFGLGDFASMIGAGPPAGLEDMQAAMKDAKADYAAYRPEMWAARMGALQKTMNLFQPVNAKMGELYGSDAMVPLDAAFEYDYATPAPGAVAQEKQAAAAPAEIPMPWRGV
jgi:hypothetical protein